MAIKNQWVKRVEVFHYFYQILMINQTNPQLIIKTAFEEYNFDAAQMKVIEFYANNINDVRQIITNQLVKNWTWERIPQVTKAILINAYCESQVSQLDKKIIIDQALITAGKYCEANDKKFINAILDKIIK